MIAPAVMITPDSASGMLKPCHSANCEPSTSGKRTLRYSLIGRDSTAGTMPKATVPAVSTAGESHSFGPTRCMPNTASDGSRLCSRLDANAPNRKYSEYAIVRIEPTTSTTSVILPGMPVSSSSCRIASRAASLATNPNSGGIPAIDAAEITASEVSHGCFLPRPDSSWMSRVPVVWSMAPTIMNSAALNIECANVIARPAIAASREPTPMTVMMKPSWLTVP